MRWIHKNPVCDVPRGKGLPSTGRAMEGIAEPPMTPNTRSGVLLWPVQERRMVIKRQNGCPPKIGHVRTAAPVARPTCRTLRGASHGILRIVSEIRHGVPEVVRVRLRLLRRHPAGRNKTTVQLQAPSGLCAANDELPRICTYRTYKRSCITALPTLLSGFFACVGLQPVA